MIKSKVLALLFANIHDEFLPALTARRSMGSVPFCGRYRLIDFDLSALVAAGITQIGVIASSNYHSLMDHLGAGRDWDLARKIEGLTIYPPFSTTDHTGSYAGRIDPLYNIIDTLRYANAEYVILLDCDHVANLDIDSLVSGHIESGADITILCTDELRFGGLDRGITRVNTDESGRVCEMLVDVPYEKGKLTSMNGYILSRELLSELVADAHSRLFTSFEKEVICPNLKNLKVCTARHCGYVSRMSSMASYFAASMSLLEPENMRELFYKNDAPVYTKVHDDAPVRYGIDSHVENSLIADGCVIEGEVINSVLFRGVHIEPGVKVENCILMQNTLVSRDASLKYVITDKYVSVGEGRVLVSHESYPLFIEKSSKV